MEKRENPFAAQQQRIQRNKKQNYPFEVQQQDTATSIYLKTLGRRFKSDRKQQ